MLGYMKEFLFLKQFISFLFLSVRRLIFFTVLRLHFPSNGSEQRCRLANNSAAQAKRTPRYMIGEWARETGAEKFYLDLHKRVKNPQS
jgi:hypothetical protein